MPVYERLFNETKGAIPQLAELSLGELSKEAVEIISGIVELAKPDLRSYSLMLAADKVGEKEFESAVRGKILLGKVPLLEIKEAKEESVDYFLNSIVRMFVSNAVRTLSQASMSHQHGIGKEEVDEQK